MSIRIGLAGVVTPGNRLRWLAAALLGIAFLPLVTTLVAEAKTPGSTYCYYGTCHRVKTVLETEALIGREELLQASFYDDCSQDRYNPCGLTSSGEVFRPNAADNAASPIYPDGTTLLVRNPANQETAVVRVNNAGPYWGKRKLDVSKAVAEKLGFRKSGVANLEVRVVKAPKPAEARYSRHRKYDPVPGYIGRFANADAANVGVMAFMALEKAATALAQPVGALLALAEKSEPQPAATPDFAAKIKTRVAKASRAGKATRLASSRKASAKRKFASKSYGKKRYASSRSSRGKAAKLAYKSRAKAQRLASAKRGSYGKTRHARNGRAKPRAFAWSKRRFDGKSRTAQRRAARLARL